MSNIAKNCAHNQDISCTDCRLSNVCLPFSLSNSDIGQLDSIVNRGKPLQKNQTLYEQGSAFHSIFAVRSGAFKTYRIETGGSVQIMGFYLPGEVIGLDGLSHNQYATTAKALDTSAVCKIPFAKLESLSRELPSLQHHFFKIMSRELIDDQKKFILINKHNAEERVASLLLSVSARQARRQLSSEKFMLPMSRQDIANFLGLTNETISRTFKRLRENLVIETQGKEITITNLGSLRDIAGV